MGGHGEMQRETGSMARRPDVSLLLKVNVTFGRQSNAESSGAHLFLNERSHADASGEGS